MLVKDLSMPLQSGQLDIVTHEAYRNSKAPEPKPPRQLIPVVDYDKINGDRFTLEVAQFSEPTGTRTPFFAKLLPQLGDTWQSCWRTHRVSAPGCITMPILVLLPRETTDKQSMTVLLTLPHNAELGPIPRPSGQILHVKLLHYK